ncbi:hypothetical protein ACK8N7_36290 [Streptomyces griseobrunneus]
MDGTGDRAALLSVSSPGVHFGDDGAAVRLARSVNDEGAALVAEHPGRFGLLASLPLPDVAAAVSEAERALGELNFHRGAACTSPTRATSGRSKSRRK